MPLEFRSEIVFIPSGSSRDQIDQESDTGEKEIERTVPVGPAGSLVRNAAVALSGYRLDYEGIAPFGGAFGGADEEVSTDHHIDVVEAFTQIVEFTEEPTGAESTVTFLVRCEYKDRNGDDSYGGYVAVTVIADVEPAPGSTVTSESVGHAGLARDASSQPELPA